MIRQHTVATPYMVGDVHCYSAVLEGELVLFDTGPPTEAAWNLLRDELDLTRLRHLFITHCHIDHWGHAARLANETGATLYLPQRDADKIAHHRRRIDGMMTVLHDYGFEREYIERLRAEIDSDATFPPFPQQYEVVETSTVPARLGIEVLPCPGHSQSDLVYRIGERAVTGDVLLRGIFQTPLLDLDLTTFSGRFHNYRAYCNSLANLTRLRDCQILPGHRHYVESVDATLLFYLSKLLDRAAKLKPFVDEQNICVLLDRLFDRSQLALFHIYLKASEVIFMQDLLREPQLLRDALEKAGLLDPLVEKFNRFA